METRVITGSRWKSALLCVAFLPLLMLLDPEARTDRRLLWGVGFFALCGAFGLIQTLWPARLALSAKAFEYAHMGRRWSVAWRSIETLVLWRNSAPRAHQTLVGWKLRPEARQTSALAKMSSLLGVDGALPGMWRLSPKDLLAVMQDYHHAASAVSTSEQPHV